MATVCTCSKASEVFTIFQTEDNFLSLSKLFEYIRGGRVSISSKLSAAQLEKVFIGKSKENLTIVDPTIQLSDILKNMSFTLL